LLVAAKGKEHYAVEFPNRSIPAVASSIFLVLRIIQDEILPAFLNWQLNLPHVQKLLSDSAEGTALPVINKADLEKLEIFVPSIQKQELILRVHDLYQQENRIRQQIDVLRNRQIQQEIINALSN
jgi:restriction endonuclease S subunit